LTLAGFAASDPEASPDPESATLAAAALLANATLPLTLPLACGAKVTVNGVLCPGESVRGKVKPLTLKPAPLAVAPDTVTAVPPEFVRLPVCFWLVPTGTLPKLSAVGFAASAPALTPVPVIAAVSVASVAFEAIRMPPAATPGAAGANVTLKLALWPGDKVKGKDNPVSAKPVPEAVAAEIDALVPPVFVTETVWL
jgi:hypothetical protein